MTDPTLRQIVKHLWDSLDFLAQETPATEQEFLGSPRSQRLIERVLQTAIQGAIDIAETVIAVRGAREPGSAADSFRVLTGEGLLDAALSQQMEALARFRNILVHGYVELQPSEVYRNATEGVRALRQFAGIAAEWVGGEDAQA
jgi:uncharacterized protein YutE (UPF0331/DUF86 family)